VSKTQAMKSKEAASHEEANALNRYIKLGIILILVGLLVGIVFGFLGYILSIIGVVLIILGLLDEI
jgi:sulfite exporter TauE/SafE